MQLYTMQLIKNDKDFFVKDAINPSFHENGGRSGLRTYHENLVLTLADELEALLQRPEEMNEELIAQVQTLQKQINGYDMLFGTMINEMLARGFEDYGVEGLMREAAHDLEASFAGTLDHVELLMLRRHEKDFLLRNQEEYAHKFLERSQAFRARLSQNALSYEDELTLLDKYELRFEQLVVKVKALGLQDQSGMKADLNQRTERIEGTIKEISRLASDVQNKRLDTLQANLFIMVGLCLVAAVWIGIFEARKMAKPIKVLREGMQRAIQEDFKRQVPIEINTNTVEVVELAESFKEMLVRIQQQIHTIESSKEELEAQNDKLKVVASELQESNGVKDKFFSIIAHDLKGPMATLGSFLDLLIRFNDGLSKEETTSMAKEISKSLKSLSELLENLLEWSRAQMGTMEFKPTTVDMHLLLQKNLELFNVRAQEKGISVTLEAEERLLARADFNMIDFVVRNLLGNALKFTLVGGHVWLRASVEEGKIQVSVRDNGVGISLEDQKKLFRPDQHVTRRGTSNEKGTGLGLILCQEFIMRHQGRIWLESIKNEGTTFYFTLQPAMELV